VRLAALQDELAELQPAPWRPPDNGYTVGASYCCAEHRGTSTAAEVAVPPQEYTERGWAAAAVQPVGGDVRTVVADGPLRAGYVPGALALREGPLREAAVRHLDEPLDVLLVDAAGRDHPRRAGLALHLGAVLDVPTVGATDRPLRAGGAEPADRRGAFSPLLLDGEVVGHWLRVRPGVRPLAVHAAWRTDPEVAVEVVLAGTRGHRTPEVLRHARLAARAGRARARR
jgi:deoxyribonuclease V